MAAAIGLRDDFDGTVLRGYAKATKDAAQGRRLLALAEIYDGGSRSDGARIGAVGLQTVRDWVLRFNARGPAGLIDGKAPGNPPKLNDAQRQALAGVVETGPIPAIHGVVRWRRKDLAQWIWEGEPLSAIGPRTMASGISLDETTVGRELKGLGFSKISARPRHYAQNEFAIEAFKKTSPPNWRRSGRASRSGQR
jgi:transposase